MSANIELSGLEVSLVNTMSRETVMRTYLNEVRRSYDYILIDCSPSLGMLTLNALTAAAQGRSSRPVRRAAQRTAPILPATLP